MHHISQWANERVFDAIFIIVLVPYYYIALKPLSIEPSMYIVHHCCKSLYSYFSLLYIFIFQRIIYIVDDDMLAHIDIQVNVIVWQSGTTKLPFE